MLSSRLRNKSSCRLICLFLDAWESRRVEGVDVLCPTLYSDVKFYFYLMFQRANTFSGPIKYVRPEIILQTRKKTELQFD